MSDPHDSCSMTPPLSPVNSGNLEQEEMEFVISPKRIHMEVDDPVNDLPSCFCCLGDVNTQSCVCHPDGYLKRNSLGRLLHGTDPNFEAFQSTCCEMFGYYFTTQCSLEEQMDKLFFMARQQVSKLETMTVAPQGWSMTADSSESFMKTRHNIRNFLEYIKVYFCRFVNEMNIDQLIPQLTSHLHILMLHLGRLTELPSSVLNQCSARQGNTCTNTAYHTFHGHLDVHWGILEILHLTSNKYPNTGIGHGTQSWCQGPGADDFSVDHSDPFQQCLLLLLWDLVVLAMRRYRKVSVNNYTSVSPFHCTCVRELWVMIRQLADHRQEQMGKNSFWISLDEILQQILHMQQVRMGNDAEIDSDKFFIPPNFECSDTNDFCWWLIHHVAPLYRYNCEGEHVSQATPLQNNYVFLIQNLLKPVMSEVLQIDEAHMRRYLGTCLHLCNLWRPNTDVLIHFWNYFYKQLNNRFQIQGLGVEGLAKISKSALAWLDKCKTWTKPDSSVHVEQMTSFQLFLKLLCLSVGQQEMNNSWKQLKGRFYSKFHPRRMQELTETGLHNFTELFITLALVGDLEDVAGKMSDFYAMLHTESLGQGSRAVIWRGMFVFMLIYEEKGVDISFPAERMVNEFNTLSREFSHDSFDSSRRAQLWFLLNMYFESVQDIFETSDQLKLSESKLLGQGLGQILPAVSQNELRVLLNFLLSILARHRIIYKRISQDDFGQYQTSHQFKAVSDALWASSYQFIQTHSCTATPPPQLADVGASFTLLALNFPPGSNTGIKEDFMSSFQYFACSAAVSASVSCRFLNHMLPNQLVIERLSAQMKNYQPLVIQAWLRCALYLFKDNDQMQELSRLILKLPEICKLFDHVEMEASDSYSSVVIQFIVALGMSYSKTEGLMNKIKLREHATWYFGDIARHMSVIMKNTGPPEALKAVYVIGGYMTKHCAQLLYVKSKPDCLLPSLIDSLILPHVLFNTSKTMHATILQVIRDHLHLFVQGLGKLDLHRDQYIQRQLRTTFLQYLPRFPLKQASGSTVTTVHPLINSLSESLKTFNDNSLLLRHFVFEVIKENYLTLKGNTPPTQAGMGLTYLDEVCNRTVNKDILARDARVLLHTMLEYQLVCEVPALRQQSTCLMQVMLEACKKCDRQDDRCSLVEILGGFVSKHIKLYQLRLLKVVEKVSVLHPNVVVELIPQLTQSLIDIEAKRGVGADTALRQSYTKVLGNLGEKGQEELIKMQNI